MNLTTAATEILLVSFQDHTNFWLDKFAIFFRRSFFYLFFSLILFFVVSIVETACTWNGTQSLRPCVRVEPHPPSLCFKRNYLLTRWCAARACAFQPQQTTGKYFLATLWLVAFICIQRGSLYAIQRDRCVGGWARRGGSHIREQRRQQCRRRRVALIISCCTNASAVGSALLASSLLQIMRHMRHSVNSASSHENSCSGFYPRPATNADTTMLALL